MTDSPPPAALARRPRRGTAAAVLAAVLLIVVLQGLAIHRQSLTGDESYHLLAGHQALRYGQNLLNWEHPPLAKLVAALPTLVEPRPLAPPQRVEGALPAAARLYRRPAELWRLTVRGRWLVFAVFVLPFLLACYALGRRFGGPAAGIVLALAMGLSFDLLAFYSLALTDAPVALAYLLSVLAAIALAERPDGRRAALLGLAWGLGLAIKFSAVLFAPTALAAVVLARPRRPLAGRLGLAALVGGIALAVVAAVYAVANWHGAGEASRATLVSYCQGRGAITQDLLRPAQAGLLALHDRAPGLAQWATGLLGVGAQNRLGVYPTYAFGTVTSVGRWWYFPAVLLVKTPLALLIAALAVPLAVARRHGWRRLAPPALWRPSAPGLLVLLTAGVYLVVAMASNYNLGVRHLMPVVPLLLLPLAMALAARRRLAAAALLALALEAAALTPQWLSATNTWWLGERNPTRFALSLGDLEYRQGLIMLADAARCRGITGLRVFYPLLAPEVLHAYLPDAELVTARGAPQPGWYAVNVLVEQMVPAILEADPERLYDHRSLRRLAERYLPFWRAVQQGEDHGWVAGTFHLYHVVAEPLPAATPAPVVGSGRSSPVAEPSRP